MQLLGMDYKMRPTLKIIIYRRSKNRPVPRACFLSACFSMNIESALYLKKILDNVDCIDYNFNVRHPTIFFNPSQVSSNVAMESLKCV